MLQKWENPEVIGENRLPGHSYRTYGKEITLNGEWAFRSLKGADSDDGAFYLSSTVPAGFGTVQVPGCVECQGYGQAWYFGAGFPAPISKNKKKIPSVDHKGVWLGLYYRSFTVPADFSGKRVQLCFGSVKSAFLCWINGREVGMGKGSMLPVEFDVTDYLLPGENTLALKVYSLSDATYLEDQDMWFLSGIDRDVTLRAVEESSIADYYAKAAFAEDYKAATLQLTVRLNNPRPGQTLTAVLSRKGTEEARCSSPAAAELRLELHVSKPALWSAEAPELYDLCLTLTDAERELDRIDNPYGFREITIDKENAILKLNGMPLKLRGVNYHAFTPDGGYYVSPEVYERDLQQMKRFNINAIRTSHYPQADYFYTLCDRYGIYVMDEVNVETHAVRTKGVPHAPVWTAHVVDRMERMVLRDRNHPSVIIYSLGNESNAGPNHYRMKEAALALDATRPIHYEGGKDLQLSDFLCDGYSAPERERRFANGEDVKNNASVIQKLIPFIMSLKEIRFEEYKHHPIVATEYNYCMGNAGTEVTVHTEIFDRSDRWCGGFAWDYKDKSIIKYGADTPDGKPFLAYGGDMGVRDQQGNICCDGMTDPFGTPHSVMYEIRKAFAPVVPVYDAEKGTVCFRNRNSFTALTAYDIRWQVSVDGNITASGTLAADGAPRTDSEITDAALNAAAAAAKADTACRIATAEITVCQREATLWAAAGTVITAGQTVLTENAPATAPATGITVREDKDGVLLSAGETGYRIAPDGNLAAVTADGRNLLKTPLRPALYRAVTDGDAGFVGIAMGTYKKTGIFGKLTEQGLGKPTVLTVNGGAVTVTHKLKELTLERSYTLLEGGKLLVSAKLTTGKKRAPVRFGMQAELEKEFDTLHYLGKGPHDNYWGREEGSLIGSYTQSVTEQDEYVRPQEHGNRRHVVRADMTDGKRSLCAEQASGMFAVSVLPYTLKALQDAQHIHELPGFTATTLSLDCLQNGLGDCFVRCPQEYRLQPDTTYEYSFILSVE